MTGNLFDPVDSDDPVIIESYICETCGSIPAVSGFSPNCRDPYGCGPFEFVVLDEDIIYLD